MPLSFSFDREPNQVHSAGDSCVKKIILNRARKLNALNHEMLMIHLYSIFDQLLVCEITKILKLYENDPAVKLVILKANGRAFCVGGDVASIIITSLAGHWSYIGIFYRKILSLVHLIATYNKPLVCLVNGIVMGGGAALSVNGRFKVVTEKAVLSMPETSIGFLPDAGASFFLSRLPGNFGEYVGLTGARLDGAEMVSCGLATHFVLSKDLSLLENALQTVTSSDVPTIAALTDKFTERENVKEDSPLRRLEKINKCFSKRTVEEIIMSLENEMKNGAEEKWMIDALSSMRSSSPNALKIFLRSVREARQQNIEQCFARDYNICAHLLRRTLSNDLYEGTRAKVIEKDNKPKWEPLKLQQVKDEMVNQYFRNIYDEDWQTQQVLVDRSKISSKL